MHLQMVVARKGQGRIWAAAVLQRKGSRSITPVDAGKRKNLGLLAAPVDAEGEEESMWQICPCGFCLGQLVKEAGGVGNWSDSSCLVEMLTGSW